MSNRRSYSASQYTGGSKKRGMSPGRSMAQFGHAGHAGKSQAKAQKHQKAGINTPSSGPGSNPNIGQTPPRKTTTVSTPKKTTTTKKTTLKDKLIRGGRTLGEWKHIMDIISGNVPGIIKNIGFSYGANKFFGDQAYRGGDIQPWDKDDVSGIGSFNLADMGITTPDTDYTQLAKVYSTEDMMNLLGIKDQATAEKYVEDPYVGSPRFIEREKRTDPRTQPEAMNLFTQNLLEQEKNTNKTFEQQRQAALELGIRPTDRHLIPTDFLTKPGEAATQTPFKNIAAEIEKKYPMARGGIVNLYKYGGFLG